MKYYIEVFKVFLGLKWEEITHGVREIDTGDFGSFVIILLALILVAAVAVLTLAGIGYLFKTFIEPTLVMKDFGDYIAVGMILSILGAIVWFTLRGIYKFFVWIVSNWRTAKRIVSSRKVD